MALNDKNKITGASLEDLNLITNGTAESIKNITNPNQVLEVIDKNNNKISNITPLIMVINSSKTGWKNIVESLISVGADPSMIVNYYNKQTTAREIAEKYRNYII